jgi:hypothetical protein
MKRLGRAIGWAFGALAAVSLALLGWRHFGPTPVARAPTGACIDLAVWSTGYHTGIWIPAAALDPEGPLARLFPDAPWLLVGWGDAQFYQSDGRNLLLGLRALTGIGETTLHVIASNDPPEAWQGTLAARVGVTPEGAAGLVAFTERTMQLTPLGDARILAPGQVPGRSVFVRAHGRYHPYNVCNHWTARALAATGLPISDLGAWSGPAVTRQVQHLAPCGE